MSNVPMRRQLEVSYAPDRRPAAKLFATLKKGSVYTVLVGLIIFGVHLYVTERPSASSAATPLIVIDRWWDVDFAKEGCFSEGKDNDTCRQERAEHYNVFELELNTQFSVTPECAGITITSYNGPQNHAGPPVNFASRPYWSFSINYNEGDPAQPWQMLPPEGSHLPMMQAKGTPLQIAQQVCRIIKGKGALVLTD